MPAIRHGKETIVDTVGNILSLAEIDGGDVDVVMTAYIISMYCIIDDVITVHVYCSHCSLVAWT